MENQENKPAEFGQAGDKPAGPDLTITDLANIRAIIDVAVRRGAFAASEVSGVGTVFDKLNAFLNAVQPQQKPEEQKAPQ